MKGDAENRDNLANIKWTRLVTLYHLVSSKIKPERVHRLPDNIMLAAYAKVMTVCTSIATDLGSSLDYISRSCVLRRPGRLHVTMTFFYKRA